MPTLTTKKMPVKITKSIVDRLSPSDKDIFVWDSQDKGFGVKISPANKITFIVQGRMTPTANAIRITVGSYGVFTVEQARDVAREHLRSMRMGVDPRDTKRADEAKAVTLRQVPTA